MKNLMIAIISIAFASCTKTGTNVTNQTQYILEHWEQKESILKISHH
jgi:hypothetical protein